MTDPTSTENPSDPGRPREWWRRWLRPFVRPFRFSYASRPHCRYPAVHWDSWGIMHLFCGAPPVGVVNVKRLEAAMGRVKSGDEGHLIVCVDEKTSIQARQACGRTTPARPGWPLHIPDRYQRRGAVQLFAGLLVHTGDTLARCFERKRFVEFQSFLQLLLAACGADGSAACTSSWTTVRRMRPNGCRAGSRA
jgi:hypothetical protein